MKKTFLLLVSFWLLTLSYPKSTLAVTNPLEVPNNKFGIHISNENDLNDAARLVNSSGGDWGYVTLVISEKERDREKWQRVFDKMRTLHLIPLIRIATNPLSDGSWEKPKSEEVNNWIAFLNSLNWVVKNRYVIIYNEPNHAKEWGNNLDPSGYATLLKEFSQKLKDANQDFFILPAGLDASSSNSQITMDEGDFIKKMLEKEPDIYTFIDGWTSHSYPNPDFSGSEISKGRGTIETFNWELSFLKDQKVERDLPIFITETGWKHDGEQPRSGYLDTAEVEKKLLFAFENVWSDERIVSVTPFILNYPDAPFNNFSWKKTDGTFYSFFTGVTKIHKVPGEPEQDTRGVLLAVFASPIHRGGSIFKGTALVQNAGQSIWEREQILVGDQNSNIKILNSDFYSPIEPTKYSLISFNALTPINNGLYDVMFELKMKNESISNAFPYEIISIGTNNVQSESFFDSIFSQLLNWFSLYL